MDKTNAADLSRSYKGPSPSGLLGGPHVGVNRVMDRKLLKSRAWNLHAFHTHKRPNGRQVRNLGWLYRHKHLVERFELLSPPMMKPWRWYAHRLSGMDCETGFILVAHLDGGVRDAIRKS